MELLSSDCQAVKYSLCVTKFVSKYAWVWLIELLKKFLVDLKKKLMNLIGNQINSVLIMGMHCKSNIRKNRELIMIFGCMLLVMKESHL